MRIRWHGHSCFEIQDETTLVTDPHDGKSLGIGRPNLKAAIALVSHDHFDHNCTRIVKGLETEAIRVPGKKKVSGISIHGIKTFHDEDGGEKRGENIVYKFTMGGMKFCHLGDLGEIPPEEFFTELGDVDILFIPVGNVFTIGAEEAKTIAEKVGARVIIPMHYRVRGLSLSIKPVDDFISLFPEKRVCHVGNEMELLQEDLPEEPEVWVFNI